MQALFKIGQMILEHLLSQRGEEQRQWDALFRMLNGQKEELKKYFDDALRRALAEARLREIVASVKDHEEAFRELLMLRQDWFVRHLIEKTRKSKHEIEQESGNKAVTKADAVIYYALYYTVVPVRVACFEMLEGDQADIGELVGSELNDLLETKEPVKDLIADWTKGRVSAVEEKTIDAEPIPGGGHTVTSRLWYTVDGKLEESVTESEDNIGGGDRYERIERMRQKTIENLSESEWEPFKTILEQAKRVKS